jgi:hypothetical protein
MLMLSIAGFVHLRRTSPQTEVLPGITNPHHEPASVS